MASKGEGGGQYNRWLGGREVGVKEREKGVNTASKIGKATDFVGTIVCL